jgi:hypothetical protein
MDYTSLFQDALYDMSTEYQASPIRMLSVKCPITSVIVRTQEQLLMMSMTSSRGFIIIKIGPSDKS